MNPFRLPVIVGPLPVTLTNGTVADATQVMANLNWIVNQVNANAAALASVALINANNNFTVVQSGVAATQPANFPIASQIQSSVFQTFQSTLGTNTITARMAALTLSAWPTDAVFTFVPSQTNTGPSNITVDSAGSSIIFSMGSTLVGGELRQGVPAIVKRDSTKLNLLNPFVSRTKRTPTVVTLSGSGTYTQPTGSTRFFVKGVGPGAGGAAAKTNNGGAPSGATTFGPCTGNAGTGGITNGGATSAGGTASGGDLNIQGGSGDAGSNNGSANSQGGRGGGSMLGFGGPVSQSNGTGQPGTGFGSGGGGGGDSGGNTSGGGGSGGGYFEKWFIGNYGNAFTYNVGTKGTGGAAGTTAGGDGTDGTIIVVEYYD